MAHLLKYLPLRHKAMYEFSPHQASESSGMQCVFVNPELSEWERCAPPTLAFLVELIIIVYKTA